MARRTSYRRREEELGPQIAGVLMLLAIILGVGFFRQASIPNFIVGLTAPTFAGHVERVVDGNTFYMSGQGVRIRVWGLDAPETGNAGGSAATAAMSRLVSSQ